MTKEMIMHMYHKNRATSVSLILLLLLCLVVLYYFYHYRKLPQTLDKDAYEQATYTGNKHKYIQWPAFVPVFHHDHEWYSQNCWKNAMFTLSYLSENLEELRLAQNDDCKSLHKIFDAILSVTKKPANTVYPTPFVAKVRKWLGNNNKLMQEAYHQTITSVYNEYTNDHTNYNGLRDKRPVTKSEISEREYIEKIVQESRKNCDFCNYLRSTAMDTFGRIKGRFSHTAANAFRWDQWHSMVLPTNHHPVKWTEEEFMDLWLTIEKWQITVYNQYHEYKHPMVLWDLFLSAGASQLHPHLQTILHTDKYYGAMENWRRAADTYNRQFQGREYFHDLALLHESIGLAVRYKTAVAFASLTPKKDYEIVVISEKADANFYRMLYFAIRTYFDVMERFPFSMAVAFPTMSHEENKGVLPAYARIVSRGPVQATHSDIGALELLSSSSVNTDPYKLVANIRKCIELKENST